MAFDPHKNLAYTVVTVAPSPAASGTSLTVQDASVFPTPGATGFPVVIWPDGEQPLNSNAEIARCTAIVGNVLTITRAQEGSSARTILVTDQIHAPFTSGMLDAIEAAIPSTSGLLSNIKVSAGGLSALRSDLTFSNANGVSFGLETNGVITGTVATNYQSQGAYLTTAALSQDSSKYAGTNGAITGGSITVNTSGVSVDLPAYLTTAMASNRGSDFVQAAANFNGTNASGTIASNAISVSVAAQSVQTQNMVAVSLSGNTSGAQALISSGTVILAGGNNITVSQNGQSITISGPNAGGAQTGISGVIVSDATYTSGTISFSNAGNITISSSVNGATQYVRLSGNAAQTNQSAIKAFGVSNTGQTAGNTGVSTGIDWVLAGSQSITLSQSTAVGGPNTVWMQHPAWLTTAMASNRGSDFVQATAVFNGTNATGTIASGAISVSVAAPIPLATTVHSVASANSVGTVTRYAAEDHRHAGIGAVGISTSGNTAGTTGSVLGTYWFQGGNSLTVSQITSNNGSHTLVLSVGNYLTTAMASNRGSDFVQATAGFNGTNASGTIASNSISVSVAAPIPIGTNVKAVASIGSTGTITRYAPEDHQHAGVAAFAVTNTGNTLGNTRSQVGTFYIAASGAITASQSTAAAGNDTVWLSVAAQSVQSAIKGFGASNTGNTAGNTGISTGIDWVVAGSNNITISQSTAGGGPNTIWVSWPTVGGAQTVISGIVVSDTTYTSGTVSFSNQANITIGSSVNGGTQYIRLSGNPAQTNQSAIKGFGVSNTGNTAGNTGISTGIDWVLAGSNSLTLSQSTAVGGPNTIWMQVGAYLTTARASTDAIGLNTAKTNVTWTVNSSGLSFDAGGYAGTGTSATNASITLNSNGLAISVAAPGAAAENNWIGLTGNTDGNTTASGSTIVWSGGNGVTLSGTNNSNVVISVATYSTAGTATTVKSVAAANSVGTVTRWAAEDHAHGGVGGIGISTAGNSSGTTGSNLGTYWLQGGNAITISQITSNNGSHTGIISGSAPVTGSYFYNLPSMNDMVTGASAITQTSGSSIFVQPFLLPYHLSAGYLRLIASLNDSAVGTGGTPVVNSTFSVERYTTFGYIVFSQGVGANSQSLQLLTSSSEGMTGRTIVGAGAQSSRYTISIEKSYPVSGTTSSYTSSYAVSSASIVISSNSNTLFTGPQFLDLRFGVSLNPGNYWLGVGMSTGTSTNSANISFATSAGMAISLAGVSNSNVSIGLMGAVTSASNFQLYRGLGVWTTNASRYTTDSVGVAAISNVVSNPQLPFQLIRVT